MRTKILYIHYSPIIHGCMNNKTFRAKFKSFRILLDSGCSSTIVMGRVVEKLKPEKRSCDAVASAGQKYHY